MTKSRILNQEIYVKTLFALIVLTIFIYAYMVNMIAFNAAARGKAVESISILESQMSNLESELIIEGRKNNMELAANLGLVKPIANEVIVVVRDNSARLTFNE